MRRRNNYGDDAFDIGVQLTEKLIGAIVMMLMCIVGIIGYYYYGFIAVFLTLIGGGILYFIGRLSALFLVTEMFLKNSKPQYLKFLYLGVAGLCILIAVLAKSVVFALVILLINAAFCALIKFMMSRFPDDTNIEDESEPRMYAQGGVEQNFLDGDDDDEYERRLEDEQRHNERSKAECKDPYDYHGTEKYDAFYNLREDEYREEYGDDFEDAIDNEYEEKYINK